VGGNFEENMPSTRRIRAVHDDDIVSDFMTACRVTSLSSNVYMQVLSVQRRVRFYT